MVPFQDDPLISDEALLPVVELLVGWRAENVDDTPIVMLVWHQRQVVTQDTCSALALAAAKALQNPKLRKREGQYLSAVAIAGAARYHCQVR